MLIDSHCHLDFDAFADELEEVVARARAAGVARLLTICTRLDRLERNLAIVERFDDVFLAVGVHPHEAADHPDVTAGALVDIARHPKIVGIGETGLDFYYEHSPRQAQEDSFRVHIRAARASGLPVIVHTRDADDDTIRILADEGAGQGEPPLNGLIHCFSSGRQLAEKAVEFGFYVSLSGILTFNRSEDIRATVRDLPLDRLLVETDAPYLAPVPRRGKRNEPAFVVHTAKVLAEVKALDQRTVEAATTENFLRLFDKVPPPAAVSKAA
ncbi:MAG: TatD family hydrolase [Azospirillaceae bacterium]